MQDLNILIDASSDKWWGCLRNGAVKKNSIKAKLKKWKIEIAS